MQLAKTMRTDQSILVNLSGRGDKVDDGQWNVLRLGRAVGGLRRHIDAHRFAAQHPVARPWLLCIHPDLAAAYPLLQTAAGIAGEQFGQRLVETQSGEFSRDPSGEWQGCHGCVLLCVGG